MTDIERQEVYDVYLTVFSKVRSGAQMTSTDFTDPTVGIATLAYTGRQLAAAALGVEDGKYASGQLKTKSQLEAAVDKHMG